MKTLKIMSLIGMVLFPVSFLLIGASEDIDVEISLGWGALACMYGIAYSITTFIQARKHKEA